MHDLEMADGRWLHLRRRPMQDGGALVMVADVTEQKAELKSLAVTSEQFRHLAQTDPLTRLKNRRAFDEAMRSELERAQREARPLSLLMVDVDHFKLFNDRLGHQAGDECLKLVADCLRSAIRRPADMVARFGGEEFALILPDTNALGGLRVAQEIHERLQAAGIVHPGSPLGLLTVSIGAATLDNHPNAATVEMLLAQADTALYQAKASGRNRTSSFEPLQVMATGASGRYT